MDESRDEERPPQGPPRYLPRVWKSQPEPEPEAPVKKKKKSNTGDSQQAAAGGTDAPAKRVKKSRDGKPKKGDEESGKPKGALVEETPTFDTYQARQTARIVTGIIIGLIGLVFVLAIYWGVSRIKSEDDINDETLLAQTPSLDPAQAEIEARFMFSRARDVAKRGNQKLAVAFLEKISRAYPQTSAALVASQGLTKPPGELAAFLENVPGTPTGPVAPKSVTGPPPVPPAPKTALEAPKTAAAGPAAPSPAATPTGPSAPAPSAIGPAPVGPAPAVATGPAAPTGPTTVASRTGGPDAMPPAASNEPPAKALPAGFHRSPDTGVSPAGWPLQVICERDGATMVFVPGGNYRMGRNDGPLSESPEHRVILGSYYVDQHEVTIRQFDLFQKQDGLRSERARALLKSAAGANDSEDAPVTMVTAREAKDYATWAGKRLPTEAQWEIAARSADGRLYPWGNDEAKWSKPRTFRKVEPVRSFPRDVSPFGAFDMAGNAWEWTKDWYELKYYNQFRNTAADNPVGPSKSKTEQLVVRGCDKNWSITKREALKWNSRLPYVGFRCVLPVEGPGNAFEAPAGATGPAAPGQPASQNGVVPF